MPELADDERFEDNADRTRLREELRPLLVERLITRTAEEWFGRLNEAGVPNGPINTIKQGVEYAQKLGLKPVVQVGTGANTVPGIRNPITFSATPARYDLPPPELGEHTDEIRAWLATAVLPPASIHRES